MSSLATPVSRCRFVVLPRRPFCHDFLYGENRRVVTQESTKTSLRQSFRPLFHHRKLRKAISSEPPRHNSTCISPTSTTDTLEANMFALSASRITGSAVKLSVKSRAVRARHPEPPRVAPKREAARERAPAPAPAHYLVVQPREVAVIRGRGGELEEGNLELDRGRPSLDDAPPVRV